LNKGTLGKTFESGEVIVRQGEEGQAMYVIQEGQVEVINERDTQEVRLAVLNQGDFFGEVPFFERRGQAGTVRATVRALEPVRVLTVDKKTLLRRLHEDASLSYRILQTMARRIQEMEAEVTRLIVGD
jgi:CRP-like cAMP-binding protein